MEVKRTNNLFKALQKDDESVFYATEKITNNLIKKAKKSNNQKDKVFLNLFKQLEAPNVNIEPEEPIIPTYTPFVEQKKILIDLPYIVLTLPLTFCMWILQIFVF